MSVAVAGEVVPEQWEQLDGEGAKAYQAFTKYREMGAERSMGKVGEELGKTEQLLERWSSRFNWVARARAYDEHLDAIARADHETRIRELREREADAGKAMSDKALEKIEDVDALELSPQDRVRLAREGFALERRALGAPDTVTRHQVDFGGDPIVRAILHDDQTQEDAFAFLESAAAAAERARRGER